MNTEYPNRPKKDWYDWTAQDEDYYRNLIAEADSLAQAAINEKNALARTYKLAPPKQDWVEVAWYQIKALMNTRLFMGSFIILYIIFLIVILLV